MVADGHGGSAASRHCRKHLLDYYIAAAGDGSAASLLGAGATACQQVHEEVKRITNAGSTVTIIALNLTRGELAVVNLGDSEAWLVPPSGSSVRLSEDHRLDTSEPERARVRGMGGHLSHARNRAGDPAGPLRLWPGGVAQARSVGDADVGDYILARPYVRSLCVPTGGCDVVVASDGIWDALYSSAVASSLRSMRRQSASLAATAIIDGAINQRHAYDCHGYLQPRDDTTILVMRIRRSNSAADVAGGGASSGGGCGCVVS
ncbi:hypothetical protein EMIHUDRAFT_448426 [Emiliania huxleyi CCMP1516]|uniref:PPM-type phosphatase domain-containing protein n=2 Tax=Emiliania huxleyi TaxID=2903 RepID=A0A0D3IEC8_EMIH1|nr:hypothetical protein EMIHUDRAFT_448426 [Emiliania huxleyi CCMP1516]EOD09613.1 hypothetical protein EMIHUDRAFT_448426 [Emiliania huxleyi CCMP1516]|eukprot:XP_005762042.1 hypothetical protein EMIHUDRAFT_448426 [Emiliania huxleyi CCMP1516]